MTCVHETLTGWETLPAKELSGHRAIAVTVDDTTIDGRLVYHDRQNSVWRFESLTFDVVHRPVIVNIDGTGNILNRDTFKAVNILKETQ